MGASPSRKASSTVPSKAVSVYSKLSGTGRGALAMTSTVRPLRSSTCAAMALVSPSVALMSKKPVLVSSSKGTCQAQPRSTSA